MKEKTLKDMNNLVKFTVYGLPFKVDSLPFTVFSLLSTDSAELKASKEASRLPFKECWRRLGRCVILLAVMLLGGMTAQATDYIFVYNSTNYLSVNDNGQIANSNSLTAGCVWTCVSSTTNPEQNKASLDNSTSRYLYTIVNGQKYWLVGSTTDGTAITVTTNPPASAYWRNDGTRLHYYSSNTYYVYYRDGWKTSRTSNTNYNRRNYTTYYQGYYGDFRSTTTAGTNQNESSSTEYTLSTPTIDPTSVSLYNGESHTFTGTATVSTATVTIPQHSVFNSTQHYYNGILTTNTADFAVRTPGEADNPTAYNWSLSSTTYASVSVGTVTVNSAPETDQTVTLTCTARYTAHSQNLSQSATATVYILATAPAAPVISLYGNSQAQITCASQGATIYYTTDGTTPTDESTPYTGPFDLTTSPTTVKAVAVRNGHNSSTTETSITCKLPTPVISLSGAVATVTAGAGTPAGAKLYYTTDGTTPTSSSTEIASGGTKTLTNPQTIKVIAIKTGYENSDIAMADYIVEGVSGGKVVLDDREEHSWSYYSSTELPELMRSLSPADVKITYYGDGIVMTGNADYTSSSTDTIMPGNANYVGGAKVNVGGENENTFIYFKTLERGANTTTAWTYSAGNQSSAASRCPYTPIPNPFQVRPTYGARGTTDANNFTGWRGFQCWRLKSVSGGAVYSSASGGSALSVGAVINAETEIYFAPNSEYGMAVELEAVWARAYLVKGNSGNANAILNYGNLGVERNFMTLTANENYRFNGTQGRRITNVDRAVTISCYYPNGEAPDGTNGVVTGNNNNITLGADTKFENVTLSAGSYTLSGSGHYLIVGRGCANSSIGTVQGLSANSTSNIKFRVESGSYSNLYFMGTYGVTTGTMVATMGSDYDRAKNDNSKLRVTNDIVISNGGTVGTNGTIGTERFTCTVKSGNYYLTSGAPGGGYQFYISSPNGACYGKRTLIVEGGYFADIAGGIDQENVPTSTDMVNIRIKGGEILGAVYGAAQFANAYGNRRIIVTGGDFSGWIAGGANGTQETRGALYGSSYVYVGGDAHIDGSNTVINRAVGGNVFGAGCGYNANSTSGQVTIGTNVVIADDAYIGRGVYGGGSYGYTTQTANIYILGGTIDGKDGGANGTSYLAAIDGGVFGGACQNQGGTVNIIMNGGTVNGSVYGGSNYTGTLSGSSTVTLNGGTINGSLYGGGNGEGSSSTNITGAVQVTVNGGTVTGAVYGCNNHAGAPLSTVHVDIYGTDPAPSADAYALGAVFGGGNQANYAAGTPVVTVHNCDNSIEYVYGGGNAAHITNGNTDVTIYGGNKIGNVFGGGNGTVTAANVSGNTNVKIYGGTIGRVFGGSNSQGSIGGTINVTVNKQAEAGHDACEMHIDEVYGGGNMAASAAGTIAIGCTGGETEGIGDVYGGANQANITGDITLNITGGRIHNVFGGNNTSGTISGLITVNINEGNDCPLTVDNVYGGGNLAAYAPTGSPTNAPVVNLIKGTVGLNDFDPDHPEGHGCVFGGGKGTEADIDKGKVTANPKVRMYPANEGDMVVLNAIYGGGEIASVDGNTLVQIENGHVGSALKDIDEDNGFVFGAGKGFVGNYLLAQVTGNSTVTMSGGYVHNTLFGGGQMAMVGTYDLANAAYVSSHPTFVEGEQYNCTGGGATTVTISGGQVGPTDVTMWADLGYVFGAGQGYYTQPEAVGYADPSLHNEAAGLNNARFGYVNNATVTISDNAFIVGAVWGGSENGQVLGNCTVNVSGGQIGCGKGKTERYSESQWTAAKNAVTAFYNDPSAATATAIATIAAAMPECDSWPYDNPVVKNGKTYRFLPYDAYIHDDPLPEKEVNYASTHHAGDGHTFFGNVFGGGSGYYPYRITVEDQQGNDSTYSRWYEFQGRVRGNTTVNITGGHILTSIYGGCEYADVVGNCTVTMSGGTLGVPRTVAGIQEHPVTCYLFGAGKGDQRTTFNQRTNVQNTSVTVNSNAVIYGSVFGGGEDGHVKGNASVTIGGNAWIGTTGTSYYDGNIFGGGRGFGGTSISAGSIGGNVTVNISGSCKILGSVYGGGRLASVGTHFVDEDNERYGYLQGSYPGDTAQAQYHGNITLNISGGFIGNSDEFTHDRYNPSNSYSKGDIVYHNNHLWRFEAALAAGDPWDETKVTDIVHTTGGNVFGSSMGRLLNIGESDDDDADNFNPLWPGLAKCRNTQVNITGTARIYSNVYGGGELGYVMKDAKVDVNGADVTIGHSSGSGIEVAYFGSIYGGGFGSDNITIHDNDSASISGSVTAAMHAGRVYGNTDVKLQAGHVLGNIYGGGEMASVGRRWIDMALNGDELNYLPYNGAGNSSYTVNGTPHTTYGYSESVGNTKVTISGGTVGDFDNTTYNVNRYPGWIAGKKGGVFGGGKGRPGYYDVSEHISRDFHFTRMAYVDKAEVVISGGQMAAVFGGSENGHVRYDTKVTMTGGTVGIPLAIEEYDMDPYGYSPVTVYFGNLYGGGRGVDAVQGGHLGDGSGQVYGNTEVVISGGTVTHNVYGGGSIATVGTPLTEDDITRLADGTGETHVTIKGTAVIGDASARGHNSGRVFGSGRGVASEQFAARAYTHSTFVTIGSDNPGGDVCHVYGAVFGSGENGHVENHTHVYIKDGCEIGEHWAALEAPHNEYVGNVYGGGRGVDPNAGSISRTAGLVHGATHVQVTGGKIYHNIFGGGSLANVGDTLDLRGYATFRDTIEYTYHKAPLSAIGFDTSTNNGHAYIYISGGKIGIDGANNGSVFGGGRGNAGKSNYTPFIDPLPTAGFTSGSVTIGGNNYTTYHKTEDGKVISYRVTDEDEFGYDQDKTVWVLGKMRNSTSEPYEDSVVVRDYTNHTYVTGTHILVNYPSVDSTTSYPVDRSTLYSPMSNYTSALASTATATAGYNFIRGGVFGGGDNGHVRGNTEVVIQQGRIGTLTANGNGNVFGGGRGEGRSYDGNYSIDAGKVYGNTNVTINNGWILHNVYGGGNLSSVGDFEVVLEGAGITEENKTNKDAWLTGLGTVKSYTTSGGTCTVTINGGTIGEKKSDIMASATTVKTGMDSRDANLGGNVFGSSRGQSSNATLVNRMAWTNFTVVTIDDDAVVNGSVFGGGENGHVFYTATVNIDGGSVGVNNTATSGDIYRGNVYGGGRGIDPVSGGSTFSRTSGLILGNTYVNMTDGMVYHNVFGGGSMASVGTYSYQNGGGDDKDSIVGLQRKETGKAEVEISGGTVGINGANNGRVFGAGRGVAGLLGEQRMDHFTFVDRTYVTIRGTAAIAGCVFGSGDNGHVLHNTQVVMAGGTIGSGNGGSVNGNVFGSGRGADKYDSNDDGTPDALSPNAGRVFGNTDVYIVGGTMKNNIYGGGYLATVDSNTHITINTSATVDREGYILTGGVPTPAPTTRNFSGTPVVWGDVFGGSALGELGNSGDTTTLDILGGTIGGSNASEGYGYPNKGNIFGGGNGDAEGVTGMSNSPANVLNTVLVNIGNDQGGVATIRGNVFGGNNIAGSPKGNVYVDVWQTAHTADVNDFAALLLQDADTIEALKKVAALLESNDDDDVAEGNAYFALKAVYGGGNQADYDPANLTTDTSHVTIHGCAENTVKYVYGGGRAASSNLTDVVIEGGHIYQAFAGGDGSSGTGANIGFRPNGSTEHGPGNTTITVKGGAVYQTFGGSNTLGVIRGNSAVELNKTCDQMELVEVFGGNNRAPFEGNKTFTIKCGTEWNDVYGGANMAPITGNVTLNIVGGKMKRAFGGSKAAPIDGDVTVNVTGGSVDNLFGGNNVSGNITGKITVNVACDPENTCEDARYLGNVYGGGKDAPYTPSKPGAIGANHSPVVNIKCGTVSGDVFGGGLGSTAISTSKPQVVIGLTTGLVNDAVVNGNVYGGGSAAGVTGNTSVLMQSGTAKKNIFGGGLGTTASVSGNTEVGILGNKSKVEGNVYGGGNAGAVGGNTDVYIGEKPE